MSTQAATAQYPRTINLPDGQAVEFRQMTSADRDAMLAFARGLPQEDLLFLRVDITDPVVVDDWIQNGEAGLSTTLLACDAHGIVGYATVHRTRAPWTRRVGELRVNVGGAYRARGLGRVLTSQIFDLARGLGLRKLMANMTTDQHGAQAAFRRLGFIPEALLAAELFGFEDGEVTGTKRKAPGKIQRAHGGTLFLDEIGEMPLALQARMLNVLQDRTVVALGGVPIEVDIAVICATHHRVADLVRAGEFREDLYYRLNGLTLQLPPLRLRKDIIELAKALDAKESGDAHRIGISEEVLQIFVHHPWPGNVRQMHSVIRTAIAMVDGGESVERQHLSEDFLAQMEQGTAPSAACVATTDSLEKIELHAIQETIRHNHGNISAAARQLGVSRTTLYRKLKQTGFLPSPEAGDRDSTARDHD